MKLLATLGLLQLSAVTSASLLESRQFPGATENPESIDKGLMDACIPGWNSTEQKRDTPCYQAPDTGYNCTFGDGEKEASSEKQHHCICGSNMFDLYKACANCFKLHGGTEGVNYGKDEYFDAASSEYCGGKPTVGFADFIVKYNATASVDAATTSNSNALGTQTAVSLYYTAEATASGSSDGTANPTASTGTGAGATGTATGTGADSTGTGAAVAQKAGLFAPVAGAMFVMGMVG